MIEIFEKFIQDNKLTCIRSMVECKDLTAIRCGGKVDYLVEPDTLDELSLIFGCICKNEIPYKILGNGSNILISDKGFQGVFLSLKNLPYSIERYDDTLDTLSVAAHIECVILQKKCILEGLGGLEFLSGIPGTVGGLIAMNAGAFGHEISDVFVSLKALNCEGREDVLQKEDIRFSYRNTKLPVHNYVITGGTFYVQKENMQKVKERCDSYMSQRRVANLWQVPTFGSTFKNGSDYYAGELIENCELKGYSVGDACISDYHANFIINKGNASAKDIYLLIQKMKSEVKKKFNKDLELEIKLWGDFSYAGK